MLDLINANEAMLSQRRMPMKCSEPSMLSTFQIMQTFSKSVDWDLVWFTLSNVCENCVQVVSPVKMTFNM